MKVYAIPAVSYIRFDFFLPTSAPRGEGWTASYLETSCGDIQLCGTALVFLGRTASSTCSFTTRLLSEQQAGPPLARLFRCLYKRCSLEGPQQLLFLASFLSAVASNRK